MQVRQSIIIQAQCVIIKLSGEVQNVDEVVFRVLVALQATHNQLSQANNLGFEPLPLAPQTVVVVAVIVGP
jgi:hypothetical protein